MDALETEFGTCCLGTLSEMLVERTLVHSVRKIVEGKPQSMYIIIQNHNYHGQGRLGEHSKPRELDHSNSELPAILISNFHEL